VNERVTSILLTGALGLGGLTAGLVVAPAVAQAQSSDTTTADVTSGRASRIADALSGLVSDGTITRAQADRVATTLADQLPHRGGRHGGHGGGRHLEAAAKALGVSEGDLRTELRAGRSLAQVAQARGVPRQALVDALVAAASSHLDEQVAEGELTQAQADRRKAGLAERVEAKVDQPGLRGRGGRDRSADAPPVTD
jgi:ribosomal protein S20